MKRGAIKELRGASRLAIDATERVTSVVESMHQTIASGPAVLGRPFEVPARLMTKLAYGSVRAVTRLVGASIDGVLATLDGVTPEGFSGLPGPERAAVVAALNGVLGDYLAETDNPLAIEMALRHAGADVAVESGSADVSVEDPKRKLLLLLHGSSMHDGQWAQQGHDHGTALARDLGLAPIYALYNSGLHVSTNGRKLADLVERLVAAWPVPVDEITIVGHSMGGLVARSACFYAEGASATWREKVRRLVCIGTPHHGAALERVGNLVEPLLGVSRYSEPLSRLGRLRSAGVTDLRYGSVLDQDWQWRDRFAIDGDIRETLALPDGVRCFAVAGTTAKSSQRRLPGDGLVAVDSALGRHADPARRLAFAEPHTFVAYGTGHIALLASQPVYEKLRAWVSDED
jgi:pimeloyl-ACP methyl ester carboxylesterase